MDSSYTQKKDIIERELANDLYNSTKYYLEKFTVFKRKYFSFTEGYWVKKDSIDTIDLKR